MDFPKRPGAQSRKLTLVRTWKFSKVSNKMNKIRWIEFATNSNQYITSAAEKRSVPVSYGTHFYKPD